MSLASAFGAPVVLTIGEKTLVFPLLKMKQIAVFCAILKAKRVADGEAAAAELKGMEKARFLQVVKREDTTLGDVIAWSCTADGANAILAASLDGVDGAGAIIDGIPGTVATEIAARVLGWEPPAKEDDQNANPTTAGQSSGSATAGSSSTSTPAMSAA